MRKLWVFFFVLLLPSLTWGIQKESRSLQESVPYQREWRFNRGIPQECFGEELCTANWGVATGYEDAQRYQCVVGGTVTKIRILSPGSGSSSGTVRMGVYSTSGGNTQPNVLLWEGTDQPYVAGAWMEEDVTGLEVTAGTYYWLAYKVSNSSTELCYVPGGPSGSHQWKSGQTYSASFYSPWFYASGNNTNRYTMQLCVGGGVTAVYSGKFPRGIARGIMR